MLVPKKTKQTPGNFAPEPLQLDKFKIDLSQTVTQQICVTIQDKTILTYGSLLVLTGKPKARKTSFLNAFLAAAITQQKIWSIGANLLPEKNKIVLIDTEQSLFDLFASIDRLSFMTPYNRANLPNFSVYTARAGDVTTIQNLITSICENNPDTGIIAIDGLIDLVNDINDVREAKAAINFLKQICDKYNVAIIGIIHQNKATNYSLGHLGAYASRFAQSELQIEKNEDNTSTMTATFLRSADTIEPVIIAYDEQNKRYDTVNNLQNSVNNYSLQFVEQIFAGRVAITYSDLIKNICRVENCSQYHAAKKIVPALYDFRMIEKRGELIQICTL